MEGVIGLGKEWKYYKRDIDTKKRLIKKEKEKRERD